MPVQKLAQEGPMTLEFGRTSKRVGWYLMPRQLGGKLKQSISRLLP